MKKHSIIYWELERECEKKIISIRILIKSRNIFLVFFSFLFEWNLMGFLLNYCRKRQRCTHALNFGENLIKEHTHRHGELSINLYGNYFWIESHSIYISFTIRFRYVDYFVFVLFISNFAFNFFSVFRKLRLGVGYRKLRDFNA